MGNPQSDYDKRFPDRLRLANGTSLERDPSRFLLFLKQPYELRNIESIIANIPTLRAIGLALEGQESGYMGRTSEQIAKQINHTDKRFWVKAHGQQSIDQLYTALIESELANNLERVAGVYSIPGIVGIGALNCPMPHSLIIVKRATADDNSLDQVLAQFNLEVIWDLSKLLGKHIRYCVLKGSAQETVFRSHVRLYREYRKLVETVVLDFMPILSPNAVPRVVPTDEYYAANNPPGEFGQWNMKLIGAEDAWDLSKGTDVTVALIDPEGVDASHGDFPWSSPLQVGVTFNNPPSLPPPGHAPTSSYPGQDTPAFSHGTQCAGILAARMNNGPNNDTGVAGLACECSLLPIRAKNRMVTEWGAGIAYAAITGRAQVISMSFGESYVALKTTNVIGILDEIIKDAFINQGVVIVAASGNSNSGIIDYPACHPHVMACGASNGGYADPVNVGQEDLKKRDYRCQPGNGPLLGDPDCGLYEGSNYGPELSVMAPGVNIISTAKVGIGTLHPPSTSDYDRNLWGTSLATPHVAGVAALLTQKFPALANNPQRVRDIIERTAEKVHDHETPGYIYADDGVHLNGPWCSEMGYGRINAFRALDYSELLVVMDHPIIEPVEHVVTRIPPVEVTIAEHVAPGENICYVDVQNNGPADVRNVRVQATIWLREQVADVRPPDVSRFDRKMALLPVEKQAIDITTRIINKTGVPNVYYLEVKLIPGGQRQRVRFALNGDYLLSWARGGTHLDYDLARERMGPGPILLLVVEATANNDYAYQSAIKGTIDNIVMRRGNVAVRKLQFAYPR